MSTRALPTYVEPAPEGADEPDPASAALVFRVGVADTDYLQHGELHVLTRLIAASVDHLPVRPRAVVGTVSSSVEVVGAPDDVAQAVHTMASWLREPDWSGRRAVTEEVLAEGTALGGADDELAGAALSRWGRRGIGLIGLAPAGLATTRVEELEAWRTGYFTAGNACLIGDHSSLADLEPTLPSGPAVPPHGRLGLALPLPGQLPRVDRDGNPVSARAGAATITALTDQPAVTRVLAGVLTTTLNAREGLDRARTRTRALSVGSQLLWLYEHGATGPAELYAALRSVAHGDLDPDVLTSTVQRLSGIPRGNALARAERTALTHLWGLPVIRDLQEITAEEVVAEARDALPSVLVLGASAPPLAESVETRERTTRRPGPAAAERSACDSSKVRSWDRRARCAGATGRSVVPAGCSP